MEKVPPQRDTISLHLSATSASAYIFNCSAYDITQLRVNNNDVIAPSQSLAGISAGSPPSSLAVPLSQFTSSTGTSLEICFEGSKRPAWSQTAVIQQAYSCIYLWCYSNGFILADQNGRIFYMFGQSATSLMAPLAYKKRGAGQIVSVTL